MTTRGIVVALLALAPSIAWAACPPGTVTQYCFPDPFAGASIPTIISYIISALLSLVGALFFVMFLWGGFQYMTGATETSGSGTTASKIGKAKKTLTNAVIGLIIVALAYVLVTNVLGLIQQGRTPGTPANIPSRPGDVLFE